MLKYKIIIFESLIYMKKLLLPLMLASGLFGMANYASAASYAESQFQTSEYQQNMYAAVQYVASLSASEFKDFPQAKVESQDMPIVMQSEVAFVQGNLPVAAEGYYVLAQKYNDPRFISKAIFCFQNIANQAALAKFNQLVSMLEKVVPDSTQARLYAIPEALANGKVSDAEVMLRKVMNANEEHQRDILLMISTLLSSRNYVLDNPAVSDFGDYVKNKYSKYPEALLLSSITYSLVAAPSSGNKEAAAAVPKLLKTMTDIRNTYSTWELPVFWTSGILVNENESALLYDLISQDMLQRKEQTPAIQNLYVAVLLKLNKLQEADNYIESSSAYKESDSNMLVNEGIVEYKKGNYAVAIKQFKQAVNNGYNLDGAVEFAIGAIDLNTANTKDAKKYFESAMHGNPNLIPMAGIGIVQSYLVDKNLVGADKYIESMAKLSGNVDQSQILVTKMVIFNDFKQYAYAYKIGSAGANKYMSNSKFVYQYATSATLSGQTAKAISLYKTYVKMEPKDSAGYNDYAYLLSNNTTDYKQAIALAQKAYEISPTDPAVLDTLGWAYYKDKQYNQAVTYLSKAYSATFNDEIGKHLQQALIAAGDTKAADNLSFAKTSDTQQNVRQQLSDQAVLMLLYYQFGANVSAN
jgi:tetratricopeptide (TPR) repeat protein